MMNTLTAPNEEARDTVKVSRANAKAEPNTCNDSAQQSDSSVNPTCASVKTCSIPMVVLFESPTIDGVEGSNNGVQEVIDYMTNKPKTL